jgi:membrane associated rhomboid family serine protease
MSHQGAPVRTYRGRGAGFGTALVGMTVLVALLWVLEAIDQSTGNALDRYGIVPRTEQGAVDIFIAPWLHVGWAHLVSNTVPFFVLGVLVLLEGWRRWAMTTLAVVVTSGLLVWLVAPTYSITLGASGVVFGWLTYLVARGIWTRSWRQLLLGLLVLVVYGGLLWGVLPGAVGVSWQAHLGGAIGGVLAARARRHDRSLPR